VVLLNNDLSAGRPEVLEDIEQKLLPPLDMGWSNRLKSEHFAHYRRVANEFASMVDIDPWFIDPLFRNCGEINFMKREGEDCLRKNVTQLLADIQKKYDEYQIDKPPFVIVKADAGTYGMGIMTVHNADELLELNRKQRTRMSASKGGQAVTQVIMQEGVYTFETWGEDQAVAEPVVYLLDHFVVGGFYRVHTGRGANENLNAPGMHFEPLAFAETCNSPDSSKAPDANPNRFYAYGVIGRLALLAAAREYAEFL
jgi:glutamate--cysteine ligase